jgi:hypothetical protein
MKTFLHHIIFASAFFFLNNAQLQAQANLQWVKNMGVVYADNAMAVAIDGVGNSYTTGRYSGTADFDPGVGTAQLTSNGRTDVYITKLDAAGNFVWAKDFGGTGIDEAFAIKTDASGNVYIAGGFVGTVDFDPGSGTSNLISIGNTDVFIVKLDAAGNYVWAKNMGGTSTDVASAMAIDATGNIYTIGRFSGTADFDPNVGTANLTSAGGSDIFISKLNTSGNYVWAKNMGGSLSDFANGIAIDATGNVYTTGNYNGTADFDPGAGTTNLISAGASDIFISKLNSAGVFVWHSSRCKWYIYDGQFFWHG